MIFLKKVHGNIIFSANVLKRRSFEKKVSLKHDLACIFRKYDVFFLENIILFFSPKTKDHLFQKRYMDI